MASLVDRISELASAIALDIKNITGRVSALESGSTGSTGSTGSLPTGIVGSFTSVDGDTGWLLSNGGEVSQSSYPDLFAKVAYKFSKSRNTYINGRPHAIQWRNNLTQSDKLSTWLSGTNLPGTVRSSQAVVTKNRIYLLGGFNGTSYVNTVYTAPINSDGSIGTWAIGTSLPIALGLSQNIVTNSRVYIIGGIASDNSSSSAVYTAPINSDGTLGTWVASGSLPVGYSRSQSIVTKDRVYLLGGFDSAASANIYTAPINNDGTLGTWVASGSLPVALFGSTVVSTHSFIYLIAGVISGVASSTIYAAPISSDGTIGTWFLAGNIPGAVQYSQTVITNGRIYVISGLGASSAASLKVYSSVVQSSGELSSWSTDTDVPVGLYTTQAVITSSRLYLLGGSDGNGNVASTYYTPFLGGMNDYVTPNWQFIKDNPNAGNFYLPEIYSKTAGLYLKIKT